MKLEAVPGIEQSISGLMSISLTFQYINKMLENVQGLSIVQWSLLKALIEMPMVSPLLLAKSLGVTPGTLSQTLARLSKKEFLFICSDPKDARKKLISITRKGRDILESVRSTYEFMFSDIESLSAEISKISNFLNEKV